MQIRIRTRVQKYKKLHKNSCTDNMNKRKRKRELAQFRIDDANKFQFTVLFPRWKYSNENDNAVFEK